MDFIHGVPSVLHLSNVSMSRLLSVMLPLNTVKLGNTAFVFLTLCVYFKYRQIQITGSTYLIIFILFCGLACRMKKKILGKFGEKSQYKCENNDFTL